MGKRLGRHQREQEERASKRHCAQLDIPSPHPLATSLLLRWGWGRLSANDVQDLANSARLGGISHPEIDALASIGAFGHQPSHCQRDLIARFCNNIDCVPMATTIQVPYLERRGSIDVPMQGDMDIFMPHDWVDTLSHSPITQEYFQTSFGIGDPLSEFWQGQRILENPKFANHPVLAMTGYTSKAIPITMHADGAQFQDRGSLNTLSMAALLSTEAPAEKNLLIAAVPKECTAPGPEGTWAVIWTWLVWSLQAVMAGKHPAADPYGNEFDKASRRGQMAGKIIILGGFVAFLWAFLGDMDYLVKDMGLANYASLLPCFLCGGNKANIPWNDFRRSASWRATLPRLPATLHKIMQAPGMTVWHFALDMLHVCEYGGASHAVANVLFNIVYFKLKNMKRDAAVSQVWNRILTLYDELNVDQDHRLKELRLKHFTDPEKPHKVFPVMHNVKAAEVKGLIGPIARLCNIYSDGTAEDKLRITMMESLQAFYTTIASAGMMPTASQFKEIDRTMTAFLQYYTYLGKLAYESDQCLYSFVPKMHYMAHMTQQAEYLNPRYVTCYSGEDYVGKMSQLAHTCLFGTPLHRLSHSMLCKYREAKFITFTRCA